MLTQARFASPACKHVYSSSAIRSLARGQPRIPCPVAGCAKQVVIIALKVDKDLERRIARETALAERQRRSRTVATEIL